MKLVSRKNIRLFQFFLLSFPILVSFQNCGNQKISETLGQTTQNSAGVVDGPEIGGEISDPTQPSEPNQPAPMPMPTPEPLPTPVPVGSKITDLQIINKATSAQSNVPITFGQVFKKGALAKTSGLAGKLSDGTVIPLQVNAKASHADGSLRHAIITAVIPKLALGQTEKMEILAASSSSGNGTGPSETQILAAGFSAKVQINLAGTVYSASAESILKSTSKKVWLSGPISNEWILVAPVKTVQGVQHPHLTARFAVRAIAGQSRAKVDITLENAWAYEPAPQNLTYDVNLMVGGKTVYSKAGLTHFHHSRWKKTFWWGAEPQVHIKHNAAYIIATRAVPNYDQSTAVSDTKLADLFAAFNTKNEPMRSGIAAAGMAGTGGRPDIGLNPGWVTMYLLSQDERAKTVALGMSDLAGSWSIHYRDKKTDQALNLADYPYATTLGNPGDTMNPATKQREAFPACGGVCSNSNAADTAHQPNFSYIPYMLSGDVYHLEELSFWAAFNTWNTNPGYRKNIQGLLMSNQMRGQAWSLRTIADAAYILPDGDRLKATMEKVVNTNLDVYNERLTNNPNANLLGVNTEGGYTVVYNAKLGVAPWQDDFFTQAVGHVAELGFEKAKPLLAWKSKFVVGRMLDPGVCWIDAAIYSLNIRATADGPFYQTMQQAYAATQVNSDGTPMSTLNGERYRDLPCASQASADWRTRKDKENKSVRSPWKIGEMTGYAYTNTGFPSNMQPALAYAADSGIPNAAKAWQTFIKRPVLPDYQNGPQFNIVPR